MVLNGTIFQAELDRANANQDRQIYPQIEPGDVENTTRLRLEVRDRIPLHAKIELNNQSSPGTPELRLNTSAVYNNLWQYEHSLGVQYSFSPENYKTGDEWDFYDWPMVANYSAFYRMPLGNPESVADVIATQPGNFGYDEASRKFHLPPPSGKAEINVYASRSTIDTGIMFGGNVTVNSVSGQLNLGSQDLFTDSRFAFGIYTSGHSDVRVTAAHDINIQSSRIAAYNGGNVFVESFDGNVNVGSGGNTYVLVPLVSLNPATGLGDSVRYPIYGSGIVATTLPRNLQTPGGNTLPGDITVWTPHVAGRIHFDLVGEAEDAKARIAECVYPRARLVVPARDVNIIVCVRGIA